MVRGQSRSQRETTRFWASGSKPRNLASWLTPNRRGCHLKALVEASISSQAKQSPPLPGSLRDGLEDGRFNDVAMVSTATRLALVACRPRRVAHRGFACDFSLWGPSFCPRLLLIANPPPPPASPRACQDFLNFNQSGERRTPAGSCAGCWPASLAHFDRLTPQVRAVQLQKVEGVEQWPWVGFCDGGATGRRRPRPSHRNTRPRRRSGRT